MAGSTKNLGLVTPELVDKVSETIPALANNFQKMDEKIGDTTKLPETIPDLATGLTNHDAQLADIIQYDVKSPKYGAKGDGVTDDTNAILNAINDAKVKGGKVLFPNGTYLISSSIVLGNAVTVSLNGNGSTNSIISYTGSGWAIDSSATSFANYATVEIKGLTIQLTASATGGINGKYTTPQLDDVTVKGVNNGAGGTGIYIGPIANIAEMNWGRVYVWECVKGAILDTDHLSIDHLQLYNNTTQLEVGATDAPTGISIQYLHCDTTVTTDTAIHIVKSAHTDLFTVHLEGNYAEHISIEASPSTLAGTMIDSLTYSSGVTFNIKGDPSYIDIRGCSNWFASKITNPFGSTNAVGGGLVRYTIGSVMGVYAGPAPNNAYLALSDLFLSVSGGTGVSISLSPRYSGTNYSVGSTFVGLIRKGTYINFGGFTTSPTVSVSYAG